MSHQHFSQLVEARLGTQLLDAVTGNAATKLLFRLGPADAERAAGWVGPDLRATDLQRLANYEVAASLPASVGPASPTVVRTIPATKCSYLRASESEIRRRQSRYARRRGEVEAEIAGRRSARE